jgi:hypothetical protein
MTHSTLVLFLLALFVCGCIMVSAAPPSYLVATVAGDGSCCSSSGDGGQATSASINNPWGIWQDSVGTLFIVEQNRVRAVSSSGIISTVAQGNNLTTALIPTETTDLLDYLHNIILYYTLPYVFFSVRQLPPLSTIPISCMETPMGIYS